jgi:two-component system chemotaxis response regulator CheB
VQDEYLGDAPNSDPIRVLVVEDSKVMRKLLSDILEEEPDINVVGTARDGADALRKVSELSPDVVTMDIEMPKMDGLTALQHIMAEQPIPVIMVSAMDKRQADITMKALSLGAVDFVPKTSGTLSLDIEKTGETIVSKVKMASKVKVKPIVKEVMAPVVYPSFTYPTDDFLVVIGASTGGPKAIQDVLGGLPRDLPASVLIVQHMPEGFTRSFADRLNWYTSLEVREASEGEEVQPGTVLIAPGNKHMTVNKKAVNLNDGPEVNSVRPSVDILMKAAAENYGPNCIGVLLTGMGQDGAEGMKEIKDRGGSTIAQDEKTSVVYGMPKAAVDLRAVDEVVPLCDIAKHVIRTIRRKVEE